MIPGSASVLDVNFVGFKNELDLKPVLHVKADPYSTRLSQMGVGLPPRGAYLDISNPPIKKGSFWEKKRF